jgi:4-hydroxybenzoyl-CoA thioesterase
MNKETTDTARVFRSTILVRFAACDPARIVFYPRYMEMFNDLVEDWWREGLELPFPELIGRGWGIPTVHLNVDFIAPSVLGELLSASLLVRRIGRTSIFLEIVLQGPDGGHRVRGKVVLVLTDLRTHAASVIPDDLRARIAMFCQPAHLKESYADPPTTPLAAS